MCEGYFDDGGRREPRIDSNIFLGERREDATISFEEFASARFLIDTGAERTCISLTTAEKLGLDYESLPIRRGQGVGGDFDMHVYDKPVALFFNETHPQPENYHVEYLPSVNVTPTNSRDILGRDILRRFEMHLSFESDMIEFHRRDTEDDEEDDRWGAQEYQVL